MLTEQWYPRNQVQPPRESSDGEPAGSAHGTGRRRSLKRSPINWLIVLQLLAPSVLTVLVVAYAARDSDGASTARPEVPPPSAPKATIAAPPRPAQTPIERPALTAAPVAPPPEFAVDERGFVNSGARCEEGASAVAIGRTERSLVVVCQLPTGAFEYDGIRLSDGAALRLDDVSPTPSGFVARNDGATYTVSSQELLVTEGNETVSRDAMLDFRVPGSTP